MTDPSYSLPQDEPELQTENPNSTQDDEDQNQEPKHSLPESPKTKTLESSDPQNTEQSDLDQTQNQQEEQEDLQIINQKEDQHHHQLPDDHPERSGMSSLSPPTLILPVTEPHDPNPPPLTSPTNVSRRTNKKKKGGKKKQKSNKKKLQTLIENLNPIPFVPSKTLNFDKHEKLLKRLGLWDFVHIEFDRNIRVDLVAQLVANYDPRVRGSYINDSKIAVNRADLGRALKLPVKKEKGNVVAVSSEAVDLDSEDFSEDSIAFVEDFVSNWVLLHEDTWMMPNEVLNWTRVIKDQHPEKVDWAGLLWFMVDKELMQGQQLKDCYYAAHLQYLIKSQRGEEVFRAEPMVEAESELMEEDDGGEVKIGQEPTMEAEVEVEEDDGQEVKVDQEPMVEMKEDEDDSEVKMDGFDDFQRQELEENVIGEEPNVELTLGKDIVEKEEVKDGEMMDVEESEVEEQGQWLVDGKNSTGDHFLQRCNIKGDTFMDGDDEMKPEEEDDEERKPEEEDDEERKPEEEDDEERKPEEGDDEEDDEDEEEVEDDEFNLMSKGNSLEGDVSPGTLLHRMVTTQIPFGLAGQLCDQSNLDLIASRTETHSTSGGPLLFGNCSKREIGHEDDISHESLNGNNKRLRTDGPWSHKPPDFEMCMEEMQHWMGKARMVYQTKEQAFEESNMTQQLLLSEIERRDHVIDQLHKTKREEIQKKDGEIYRLERELYVMGNLLDGYRKALKETHKAFSDYRQRCQVPEEPLYKDAGPGGVVLSVMELEKQRLKQEEEDKLNHIIIEQKIKEFEEEFVGKFEAHFNEVQKLDRRLIDFENEVKLLKELSAKPNVSETSECAPLEE